MQLINAAKFRTEAQTVNAKLGRFFKSSLDPILQELGPMVTVNADPAKMARLQELVLFVPSDKQVQYALAFDVLKQAGLFIGGRPSDPSMHFLRFDQGDYSYVGIGPDGVQQLIRLEPGSLHHVFDFKWKSSNGNMQSLSKVATREFVKFRTSQRSSPFNDLMPVDMQFYWGESDIANTGFGRDDHSIKPPRLMCRFPWEAGENVAEQWYQYSLDKKATWHNIPGAAYLITKGVRLSKGEWVFFFRKSNWAPHNTKKYCYEVEYKLGAPLLHPPKAGQKWSRTNGTPDDITKYGKVISTG